MAAVEDHDEDRCRRCSGRPSDIRGPASARLGAAVRGDDLSAPGDGEAVRRVGRPSAATIHSGATAVAGPRATREARCRRTARPRPMSVAAGLRDRLPPGFVDAIGLFVIAARSPWAWSPLYVWWQATLPGPCHFELARNGWLTDPARWPTGRRVPARRGVAALGCLLVREDRDVRLRAGRDERQLLADVPDPDRRSSRALVGGSVALAGLIVSGVAYIAAMTGSPPARRPRLRADVIARRTMLLHLDLPERVLPLRPVHRGALPGPRGVGHRRRPGTPLVAGRRSSACSPALTRIQGVFLILPDRLGGAGRERPDRVATVARRAPAVDRLAAARSRRSGRAGGPAARVRRIPRLHPRRRRPDPARHPGRRGAARASSRPGTSSPPPGGGPSTATIRSSSSTWRAPALRRRCSLLGLRRLPLPYSLYAMPQFVLLGDPHPAHAADLDQPLSARGLSRLRDRSRSSPGERVRFAWAISSILFLAMLLQAFLTGATSPDRGSGAGPRGVA